MSYFCIFLSLILFQNVYHKWIYRKWIHVIELLFFLWEYDCKHSVYIIKSLQNVYAWIDSKRLVSSVNGNLSEKEKNGSGDKHHSGRLRIKPNRLRLLIQMIVETLFLKSLWNPLVNAVPCRGSLLPTPSSIEVNFHKDYRWKSYADGESSILGWHRHLFVRM